MTVIEIDVKVTFLMYSGHCKDSRMKCDTADPYLMEGVVVLYACISVYVSCALVVEISD
jgi:hypothetical protein